MSLAALAALLLATLTSMNGAAGAIAAKACPGSSAPPGRSNLPSAVGATLCVINGVRHAHHLARLRMNPVLRAIASSQSHEMLVGGYFGDDSLSGLTPMQRVESSAYARGSTRLSVGQNIAWGQAAGSTPAAIIAAWLGSAPHREILLSPAFRDIGVGISLGAPRAAAHSSGAIYTLELAARAS
jgi:uncharacterized protein YkwD